MVLPRAVTVIARASVSSRTATWKVDASSSSAIISTSFTSTVGSGRVLARETGTDDEQDNATEEGGSQAADHNGHII